MLSDFEILTRLISTDEAQQIVISPMISAPEQIGPSSVDVHLGTDFLVVERSDRIKFDPLMSEKEYKEWLKHVRSTSRYSVLDEFILHPGEFALGATLEFIVIPRTLVAHIDGRSSWARQGLKVHSTAGNIHPGSRGFVVFELENVGPVPIVLYPGLSIAQLTFDLVDGPVLEDYDRRAQSRYSGVLEMLWSAYPDDSVLRAMRDLKSSAPSAEPHLEENFHFAWKGRGESSIPAQQPSLDAQSLEMMDQIYDIFDILDRDELFILAEPVLLAAGQDSKNLVSYGFSELREFLKNSVNELAAKNIDSLKLVHRITIAFVRRSIDG